MSGAAQIKPLVINGWTLFAHPLFLDQLAELDAHLAAVKRAQPVDWMNKNAAKRQAAVLKVAFELIPQDPTHPQFRQGDTLGENNKHWFRAKFLQQYRLFFRYDLKTRTIILAWVNDDETKRGSWRLSPALRPAAFPANVSGLPAPLRTRREALRYPSSNRARALGRA